MRAELGNAVPLILDGGRCPVGIESTILDLTPAESLPPRLLRLGRVTPEQIATVIGVMPQIVTRPPDAAMPRVPGSLAAHYAPTTPLHLLPSARIVEVIDLLQSTGRRCAVLCHSRLPATPAAHAWRCLPANPRAYASALYAALRELDQADAELIIVEEIPATPAWAAVAD
ncbi:L-threonylcarbamoyladenylate synthase, partial [Candidatus Accumulibacter contiguus]|uniref:L-threonylcarbamoyladenylate synthase n=1 Tax=Candidatus Accumulibacter contiguus TaxID=2954381 RepID=UPI0027E269B6